MSDEHLSSSERRIWEQARALVAGSPPSPWRRGPVIGAGGVYVGGWTSHGEILLVSPDGYSVSDPITGNHVIRDRNPAVAAAGLTADRIGFTVPATGERVPAFGIWGGDGVQMTSDGWEVEVIHPNWPRADAILRTPFVLGSREHGYVDRAHKLRLSRLDGWLKAGFSPSGLHLMLLGSAGAEVFSRDR